MIYYSFTTITTVGFGDFHPKSSTERLFSAILMFIGVIVFSYIMGFFQGTIELLFERRDVFDDADNLSKFISTIQKFNGGHIISLEFKE